MKNKYYIIIINNKRPSQWWSVKLPSQWWSVKRVNYLANKKGHSEIISLILIVTFALFRPWVTSVGLSVLHRI